jgi:uncharacterized protein YkwD
MEHAPLFSATWPTFVCKVALFAAVALGGPGCTADIGVTGPSPANPLDEGEEAIMKAINDHRAASGAGTLALCASLNVSASAHSDDMRDQEYQSDTGKDGSTPMSRACKAGYTPACSDALMAEVIASGSEDPAHTVGQWKEDATASPILVNAGLRVIGVGRTFRSDESPIWTVDFGGQEDPSCD